MYTYVCVCVCSVELDDYRNVSDNRDLKTKPDLLRCGTENKHTLAAFLLPLSPLRLGILSCQNAHSGIQNLFV